MENQKSTPPPLSEGGTSVGLRLYRYRAVLRRFWWVLLLCVSVGLLYEVFVIVTKPTRFVSVGKLSVSENVSPEAGSTTIGIGSWWQTIAETLKSPVVRERAVKKIALERPQDSSLADTVEISAQNEPNTFIFDVTGAGTNPEFTRAFVNATMDAFMQLRREEGDQAHNSQVAVLQKQADVEKQEMETSRAVLDRFKEDSAAPFVEQQSEQISTELSESRRARGELLQQVNMYKNLSAPGLLDVNSKTEKKGSGTSQGNDSVASRWIEKQEQLAIKEAELKERSTVWKPAHPRFQQLEREVSDLRLSLDVLKAHADKNLEGVLRRIDAEIKTKDEAILELETKARNFSKITSKYAALKEDVERHETTYKAALEALNKIRTGSAAQEILGLRQPASPPVIENKGVVRHILTGLIGGFLIGLTILFLLDRNDDRLASSSEMIEQFNEAIVGQIPDVASSRTHAGLPLLQEEDQRFMFAEAFRSLRSSLIFMPNQTELKTLIVTSAIPNEGKSTITSNLAITMANAGARVLLVDADLRRGDIAALFDLDGRTGFSNVLRGEAEWKSCIQKGRKDNLHIIPRGPTTNQSGELLLMPILPKLLEEWKAAYDLILFNTAPILATDDTPTVAPNFDGTLMVIRASFTSARLTRNALNALYQRQVNVLGLILNCVDTEIPGYNYYQYPKYYAAQ
ncbi:MAG: polysaccharide biosynthesis tyrosine autokinase [Verrucomicrobia bacterium]|nr:polysaccharide biosynthesis tyrosine autokinase [Verrucomicrobiota bacterium]